jgi:hypothetical protein
VIAANDDFVLVWKAAQPVDSSLDLADGAIIGKIAGMYQKIAIGDIGPLESMCIGETDNADWGI